MGGNHLKSLPCKKSRTAQCGKNDHSHYVDRRNLFPVINEIFHTAITVVYNIVYFLLKITIIYSKM